MNPLVHALPRNAMMLSSSSAVGRNVTRVWSRRLSRSAATLSRQTTSRLSTSSGKTEGVANKKQKHPLHSSAKTQQSSTFTASEQEAAAAAASRQQQQQSIPRPTRDQLRILFTASAIPMIGFGFMDNIVMIQAGQFIDNTIGVTMGLATMTAAAAGQVVSDVSGVIFGGSLERFLHRYKLIQSSTLTAAQRGLPICRNVAMLGAVCGVALGCGLGASCLLFMDLEARERAERAIQLQAVLNDMMMEAATSTTSEDSDDTMLNCESCTIHLAHIPSAERFHTQHKISQTGKTRIDFLPSEQQQQQQANESQAVRAAKSGQSILSDDNTILYTPILSNEDGAVMAVLEFHAKKNEATTVGFTTQDEKAAKVMARHIAIFMHRLGD